MKRKGYEKAIGALGEDAAERFLKKRGWRILARNYVAHGGELDIVGWRLGTLAFFEVKTRTGGLFGRPADAVDKTKTERIKRAEREFLAANTAHGKIPVFYPLGITVLRRPVKRRIDVLEVFVENGEVARINQIKNMEGRL